MHVCVRVYVCVVSVCPLPSQKKKKNPPKLGDHLICRKSLFFVFQCQGNGGFRGLDPHDQVKIKAMTKEALHFRRHKKGAMQIVLIWHLGAEIVAINAVFF